MRDTAGPMAARTTTIRRRATVFGGGGRGTMVSEKISPANGTSAEESDRVAPFGWEVEYAAEGGASRTNHPAAEEVNLEATVDGAQNQPTLVLYDEEGEKIAIYSPGIWFACRRNARPNGTPTGGGA